MLDRLESISRILCIGLGVLLCLQVVNAILNGDPLRHATIPELPTFVAAAPVKSDPARTNSVKTNSVAAAKVAGTHSRPPRAMRGKNSNLPASVQARVDTVAESEILGPFNRPLPMALLGIAGDDVFLRAPDGQSGMVKEGADLGGVKLLKIGTNRVLVEENGEKKELTLFEGIGGQSLLPPETNSTVKTNVPIKKKETL